MKKVINIILVSAAIFSVLSLSAISVFAIPAVELATVSEFIAYTDTGAATRPTFTVTKGEYDFRIVTSEPAVVWKGYQFTLNYPAYMTVDSGYYFQISISTRQKPPSITASFNPTTSVVVTTSDGVMYELGVQTELQSSSSGNTYTAIAGGYVGGGQPLHISSIVVTSDCPVPTAHLSTPNVYDITVYPNISVVPTPEQERHEELMQEIENSTNIITGTIEDVTANIINGYTPDDGGAKDEFDQSIQDFEDAESGMWGPFDPETWLGYVNYVFDSINFADLELAGVSISRVIDDLLFSFGTEYTSLIVISCALGLATLVLGRM